MTVAIVLDIRASDRRMEKSVALRERKHRETMIDLETSSGETWNHARIGTARPHLVDNSASGRGGAFDRQSPRAGPGLRAATDAGPRL